jgi:hypothetical protein
MAVKALTKAEIRDGDVVVFKPTKYSELQRGIEYTGKNPDDPLVLRVEPTQANLAQLKKQGKDGVTLGDLVLSDETGPIFLDLVLEKKRAVLLKCQHAGCKNKDFRVVRTSDLHQIRFCTEHAPKRGGSSKKARKVIASGIGKIS